MKLDRNVNPDGRGKYALVRLRGIQPGSEADLLLQKLHELGHVDFGYVGEKDEFFPIKLCDRYAPDALHAYALAVISHAHYERDEQKHDSLMEYAHDVRELIYRAGKHSPFCKEPD